MAPGLSTLVDGQRNDLYTGHGGHWSIMALLTVIASGLSVGSSCVLLIMYKFVNLEKVKQEHNQMMSAHHRFLHSQEP
ncbi:uncharacterized protein N7458_002580 [Penicillium daleae]|uniref:Uncharacterized protein n=1 Tax=Penicillium daleae TaxID=63821 RepID=A0AAD6CEX1_9EURO|nr:uncharacterized protein N7458_002580 [Penicillium daleae]KAJ5461028.1 hypothetical protein N7458_002580 [Penicillium daleae]